jgi:hypothetical protein
MGFVDGLKSYFHGNTELAFIVQLKLVIWANFNYKNKFGNLKNLPILPRM